MRDGGTDTPGWTLMVETARREVAEAIHGAHLGEAALRACGAADGGIAGLYRLEYLRNKNSTTA